MLGVGKVRIRGNMFALGCWVLNAWMLIKCASEGTCLRLGVECLLLGVDKVRIRGNMFVFGCLLWDD